MTAGVLSDPARPAVPAGRALALPRGETFAGLAVVLFLNGIARIASDVVATEGAAHAIMLTLNISVIVWVSLAIGTSYASRIGGGMSRRDVLVAAGAVAATLVPLEPVAWIALTLLAAYLVRTTPAGSEGNRGAWILGAVAVPMFWSKLVFFGLVDKLLTLDAILASTMLGTERDGNTVRMAEGGGFLWIAPTCSSFANVSLAVLCWMTFVRVREARVDGRAVVTCVAACASVMAVNTARIAAIGYYPQHYQELHYGWGATVASITTLALVMGICSIGVRRVSKP